MTTQYEIPAPIEEGIFKILEKYNLRATDSASLAKSVLQLSDFFIQNPEAATPWKEKWAQIAYAIYFLPLNSVRLQKLFQGAHKQGFLDGISQVYDFGAGLATASLNLTDFGDFNFTLIEQAQEPEKMVADHFKNLKIQSWLRKISDSDIRNPSTSLALFSYSLTELSELPPWAKKCEALIIVEPSTQQDGRKLLELRQRLIAEGYFIWAPCTHSQACPLLTQSKNDWCHDRVHFKSPTWFQKLENELPMKNRTLTYSYLLARKTVAPKHQFNTRVVGDLLIEKGKNRQLICRGPDREFLAWLKKHKVEQEIPRGTLIDIPSTFEKVANEIRVTEKITFD